LRANLPAERRKKMKRNESYLLFKKYAYKGQIMGYKKFHEALLEFSATMTRESTQQQVSVEPEVMLNLAGTVTGTCGHELRGVDDNELRIKDHFNDYDEGLIKRCIGCVCVCDKCAKRYEKKGMVLHNEQEEKEWLNGDSQISA
jgi:hypothetical protein